MDPLVSIIIPTKNEAGNIAYCLKSVLKQRYKNIETIIVDNYSEDNTLSIARKYSKKCFKHGKERSAQRNFGAQKARGKFLMFVDADMELTKSCIEEAVKKSQKDNIVIAFIEKPIGVNFWEKAIAFERSLYQNELLLVGARFFPKNLFLKLNGYDENLVAGEDWDITARVQKLGYTITYTKKPLIHKENIKSLYNFFNKKMYYSKNISRYANKHPELFKKQSNYLFRLKIYLKNLNKLINHPFLTLGFTILKLKVWCNWYLLRNEEKNS